MDERKQRDDVNDLVEAPPAVSAKPAHHAICRGRGQRGEAQPGHRTHDQVNAVRDFVDDFPEAVALIGEEQREMRGDVAERPDAEHPSHIDQIAGAQNVPKRRHCKRHAEKNQRPESGAMNQFIEWPRTVRDVIRLKDCFDERHQQHDKRTDAQPGQAATTVAPKHP
jgi:hypothetical protein